MLVAHNAPFDLSFLAAEWRRLGWPPRLGFAVDTLSLARRVYSFRRNSLGEVARGLRVRIDRQHRAMGDVWTTLRVFERMLADLQRHDVVTLADLLDAQGGNVLWPEPELPDLPHVLETALVERRRLWLRYRNSSGHISERWVEPLDVSGNDVSVYLVAHCLHRGEQRTFRLDRIVEMRLEPATDHELRARRVAMRAEVVADRRRWNRLLLDLPAPHLLQTWEWGQVKGQTGWTARRLLWPDGAAVAESSHGPRALAAGSFLARRLGRLPAGVGYVPKGPLLDWTDLALAEHVLADLEREARKQRLLFVKIDPDVDPDEPQGQALTALLQQRGWLPSAEQIQFRNTALLDLTPDEEGLLAGMKPKWRYNVRLAGRRGVLVSQGGLDDLPAFYELYAETGARDGFIVRPFDYYEATWRTFLQPVDDMAPSAHLLLAHADAEPAPMAGLFLFCFGRTAWYLYGASSSRQRSLMPNHLLQWEAMRLARDLGCTCYDLWGAPDALAETDPLWGVWRFKEGLGARFAPHIGAWDYPVSRALYRSYTGLMPRCPRPDAQPAPARIITRSVAISGMCQAGPAHPWSFCRSSRQSIGREGGQPLASCKLILS